MASATRTRSGPRRRTPGLCNPVVTKAVETRKGTVKLLTVNLTKEQQDSLPALARYEAMDLKSDKIKSVDEYLTDEIKSSIEADFDANYIFRDNGKIRALWKGESIDDEPQPKSTKYHARLDFTPGQVAAIRRFAAVNDMDVGSFLADEAACNIRGSIASFVEYNVISRDEGLRLMKIWGGLARDIS